MSFETLTDKIVKVRKPHTCIWCGEEITDKARYRSYIYEGQFNSDYLHIECSDAMYRCDKDTMANEGFEPYDQQRGKSWEEVGHEMEYVEAKA